MTAHYTMTTGGSAADRVAAVVRRLGRAIEVGFLGPYSEGLTEIHFHFDVDGEVFQFTGNPDVRLRYTKDGRQLVMLRVVPERWLGLSEEETVSEVLSQLLCSVTKVCEARRRRLPDFDAPLMAEHAHGIARSVRSGDATRD